MQKVIIAVFAHPDDEAFGPSGTLLGEVKAGNTVYLTTLTLGDAGSNPDNYDDLGAIREQEWRHGGELIGAASMHYLGYKDGRLCNESLIEAGQKLVDLITDLVADTPADAKIELMTNDLSGITGHIDHIVAARAACWAFYTMKAKDKRFTRIRLACIPRTQLPEPNVRWLYMEPGRSEEEIGEVVDARQYRDEIIAIMRTHRTQRVDGEMHIRQRGDDLGLDHFIVLT